MTGSLITVTDVSYSYQRSGDADISALADISLSIASGEYLAVIGHNGSGKSTLAKCMSGLLQPSSGRVEVLGLDSSVPENQLPIRAAVGMVLQNPDNQFVATIAEEEVAFGVENLGLPQAQLRERVDAALADTGLQGLNDANPAHLSAGQKTRLAIAGVLVMQPRCLILDESTAALDPVARLKLLDLLQRLHRAGLSIVIITHSMEEAQQAERIVVLDQGKLVLQGAPRDVFHQADRLTELGLDLPALPGLARGLSRRGIPVGIPLTVEEMVRTHEEARYA